MNSERHNPLMLFLLLTYPFTRQADGDVNRCELGSVLSNGKCKKCPPGHFYDTYSGRASCYNCSKKSFTPYSGAVTNLCIPCPLNVTSKAGATKCSAPIKCLHEHIYDPTQCTTKCIRCKPGTQVKWCTCIKCEGNTMAPNYSHSVSDGFRFCRVGLKPNKAHTKCVKAHCPNGKE